MNVCCLSPLGDIRVSPWNVPIDPGDTENFLEMFYVPSGLGTPWVPPGMDGRMSPSCPLDGSYLNWLTCMGDNSEMVLQVFAPHDRWTIGAKADWVNVRAGALSKCSPPAPARSLRLSGITTLTCLCSFKPTTNYLPEMTNSLHCLIWPAPWQRTSDDPADTGD